MGNKYNSMMIKLLTIMMGIFFAVTLPGCNDPIVADMEAEHIRLSEIARQELRQGLSAYTTSSQAKVFFPASDITAIDNETRSSRKLAKSAPLKTIDQDFLERTKYLLE
jgi:hypothetical protein